MLTTSLFPRVHACSREVEAQLNKSDTFYMDFMDTVRAGQRMWALCVVPGPIICAGLTR